MVRDRVAVVVDRDAVEHVVAELVEVRAARRLLERVVVRDERDRVRFVRTLEHVEVGRVSCGVLRDHRCLAVARRADVRRNEHARDERRRGHEANDMKSCGRSHC